MIPVEQREFTNPDHGHSAFLVMNELRKRVELCDVTICIERHEFHAHKVVLAGCSPYLRAMFTNGMLESDKSAVSIRDIEPPTMGLLLEFMYTGHVQVAVDNVQSLLQAASMLNMASLRAICCQFLQLHLEPSNCLGIYSLADLYSCVDLMVEARDFIGHHFLDVVHHEEFLNLSEDRMVALLSRDSLLVPSEEQVFEAALLWIDWQLDSRVHSACRLLQKVKLALLDTSYLEDVVLRTAFVRNCPKCQKAVAEAMRIRTLNRLQIDQIRSRGEAQGIYALGGRNSEDCQLRSVEKFDMLKDRWIRMPNMKVARTAVGAGAVDEVVYAVGGECALEQGQEDETLYLRCMEAFHPAQKEWIPCAEMRVARSFVATCALSGFLYTIGGEDRDTSLPVVERYHPKSNTWSYACHMMRARAGCGVAVSAGKIYVAGGSDKKQHTDRASVECYDPGTDTWSFVSEMDKGRSGLILVALDHCLYVIGGRARYLDRYFNWVERYDLWTNEWSTLTPMNTPRAWPAAVVFDRKIYVMGGYNGTNRLRSVEVFDPETDTWTIMSNMNVCRAGCAAAIV